MTDEALGLPPSLVSAACANKALVGGVVRVKGLGSALPAPDAFDLPTPTETAGEYTDADALFVEEYLSREGAPDAAVVACINARISKQGEHIARTAQRTLARPEIQSAIKALRQSRLPRVSGEITRDTITADVEEIYQMAKTDRHYPSAISAKKLQAEMHGLLDKTVTIKHQNVSTMTDADLEKIINAKTVSGEYTVVE